MECIKIIPSTLNGEIAAPPSKSLCHRAIICAALADGVSSIQNVVLSQDISATCSGVKALGAQISSFHDQQDRLSIKVNGNFKKVEDIIDCKESGSTLRFLIPISLINKGKITFTGSGRLIKRPIKPYLEIFNTQKIKYSLSNGALPLTLDGILKPGNYEIRGDVSSQFITGLMFALPLLNGDSNIIVTTKLESKEYIDLTIDILKKFGINIENNDYKAFHIKGFQKYQNENYKVEGDFSQAAFWIVAGVLGDRVKCTDINIKSRQGDKVILDIIKKMNGNILVCDNSVIATRSTTKGITIDVSDCPDLVPIIAVIGALSKGTTKIINASRLRLKESDRLKAITKELSKLGADIKEYDDNLIINGCEKLKGGIVDSWNDHRIAMALAIASIKCVEPVVIKNSSVVKKSYPRFWNDFIKLGGEVSEWSMG